MKPTYNLLEWLVAINQFIGLFAPTPEGRKRRYIKKLQRQLRKGKISQSEYEAFLSDYKKNNQ